MLISQAGICGGEQSSNEARDGYQQKSARRSLTVGESLDNRIRHCRKNLEQLCVLKAKAEAVQMLDHPMDFMTELVYGNSGPF